MSAELLKVAISLVCQELQDQAENHNLSANKLKNGSNEHEEEARLAGSIALREASVWQAYCHFIASLRRAGVSFPSSDEIIETYFKEHRAAALAESDIRRTELTAQELNLLKSATYLNKNAGGLLLFTKDEVRESAYRDILNDLSKTDQSREEIDDLVRKIYETDLESGIGKMRIAARFRDYRRSYGARKLLIRWEVDFPNLNFDRIEPLIRRDEVALQRYYLSRGLVYPPNGQAAPRSQPSV